jgi:hypothetical protein
MGDSHDSQRSTQDWTAHLPHFPVMTYLEPTRELRCGDFTLGLVPARCI